MSTWYIILFPEAVLVETTTCFPFRIDSIADTWWEYNECISREYRIAFDNICDIGGCKDPGSKIRRVRLGHWYNTCLSFLCFFCVPVRDLINIPIRCLNFRDDLIYCRTFAWLRYCLQVFG
jgi:hypothetical protein